MDQFHLVHSLRVNSWGTKLKLTLFFSRLSKISYKIFTNICIYIYIHTYTNAIKTLKHLNLQIMYTFVSNIEEARKKQMSFNFVSSLGLLTNCGRTVGTTSPKELF